RHRAASGGAEGRRAQEARGGDQGEDGRRADRPSAHGRSGRMIALVLVEHEGGEIKDATLSAITAAAKLGEVHLLVAGKGVGGVAEAAAKIAGVARVHVADGEVWDHPLAETVAPVAVAIVNYHCDYFIAAATTTGKNIAPRVAALLDVMQVSDVLSIEGPDTFQRPIYAGNAIATIKSSDAKKVLTVRTTALDRKSVV